MTLFGRKFIMQDYFKSFFPDEDAQQKSINKILDITDFVCNFYIDYIKSKVLIFGREFTEVCYPLFFSLNFHLIKSYIDSQDRNLQTKFQKEKPTRYGEIFHRQIFEIENKRTAELYQIIDEYNQLNKCKKNHNFKLTQKDIVLDFGAAFIRCCDILIEKHGPDSMGLMSAGFLESALNCIDLFVEDEVTLNRIEVLCIDTQKDIAASLEEYRKEKVKNRIMEN